MYEPKILRNPKDKDVEFMYDSKVYIVKAHEKKAFDGAVAYHALNMVNTGLVEASMDDSSFEAELEESIETMPWRQLVALASEKGVFQPGMGREAVEKALRSVK